MNSFVDTNVAISYIFSIDPLNNKSMLYLENIIAFIGQNLLKANVEMYLKVKGKF